MSKRRKKPGLPPGSVVFTGNRKVEKVFVHFLHYDQSGFKEKAMTNQSEIALIPSPDDRVDWYDMRGIHDTELIEHLGNTFDIHSLILEDVANIHQRPKFDEYAGGIFVAMHALSFDTEKLEIKKEQVAIYFRTGFLVSFQETDSDLFESVRQRIHGGKGRIRERGSDYLAYALLDTLVDHYFIVLDQIEDTLEDLEEKLIIKLDVKSKGQIHHLKKELQVMRKSIGPIREAIGRFSKSESPFVEDSSQMFIRDLYDHTIQVMDMVESYRDMLNGLQDLFITEVSFKMNQVMQLLTLIATIFIPLTFLAGIYGMNFDYMPELHYKYSYFILLAIMLILFIGLVVYFKKKKWI